MHLNGINNLTREPLYTAFSQKKSQVTSPILPNYADKVSVDKLSGQNIKANFMPVSFKGNAPRIANAYIITGEEEDLPLLITKKNDSYVIDFDSQTELIYGIDAIKYLDSTNCHHYDTQVIFPKKAEGTLHIDGEDIDLPENSAVILNAGCKADVEVKKGYPMVVISKKDYDWYERYGKDAKDINIQNKFLELMYYNSHLYNGEFTPNILLPENLRDEQFLSSIGIEKYQSRNNLVYDLYAKRDLLSDEDKQVIEAIKGTLDKLYAAQLIQSKDDGYIRFKDYKKPSFQAEEFKKAGLSDEELKFIMPVYEQARQIYKDSKFAIKNEARDYRPELIDKMTAAGIIHRNKKFKGEYIYWKECYGNEQSLRTRLSQAGFNAEEQAEIVRNWRNINHTGFDISGLKFINEHAAVYNLNDKLNNWTLEKTNWVTNSTAAASSDGKTPFIGVSMVQTDDKRPMAMSEVRKEEKLHAHPNLEEKRQTEIYVVTSGAAALNVVKQGKSCIKILKEGDLAVVGPGVAHCVNSILGEYEHVVAQVPSAFQYGFGFKAVVEPPEDYDETALKEQAFEELTKIQEEMEQS